MNFQCDSEGDTIGFHFNPRQDEEDVVLNAKLGGGWGEEQRGFENDFAFRRGEFFDAFFIATEGRFNVRLFAFGRLGPFLFFWLDLLHVFFFFFWFFLLLLYLFFFLTRLGTADAEKVFRMKISLSHTHTHTHRA